MKRNSWISSAPGYKFKFFNCTFNILFMFKNLLQGTQIAFEFYLSFQKMHANLLPFLKRALICSWTFSKSTREPISFFKANRELISIFKKCGRKPIYPSSNMKKGVQKQREHSANKKEEPISWCSRSFWKLKWNSKAICVPCIRTLSLNSNKILKRQF